MYRWHFQRPFLEGMYGPQVLSHPRLPDIRHFQRRKYISLEFVVLILNSVKLTCPFYFDVYRWYPAVVQCVWWEGAESAQLSCNRGCVSTCGLVNSPQMGRWKCLTATKNKIYPAAPAFTPPVGHSQRPLLEGMYGPQVLSHPRLRDIRHFQCRNTFFQLDLCGETPQ